MGTGLNEIALAISVCPVRIGLRLRHPLLSPLLSGRRFPHGLSSAGMLEVVNQNTKRLDKLEGQYKWFVGFMFGAGLFGGASGAIIRAVLG